MTDWDEKLRQAELANEWASRVGWIVPPGGLAVLDPIEPGHSVRVALGAPVTTRAYEAVTDDLAYTDDEASVVVEDSDRIDLDVVEHTRQSRLRAWQEQRP